MTRAGLVGDLRLLDDRAVQEASEPVGTDSLSGQQRPVEALPFYAKSAEGEQITLFRACHWSLLLIEHLFGAAPVWGLPHRRSSAIPDAGTPGVESPAPGLGCDEAEVPVDRGYLPRARRPLASPPCPRSNRDLLDEVGTCRVSRTRAAVERASYNRRLEIRSHAAEIDGPYRVGIQASGPTPVPGDRPHPHHARSTFGGAKTGEHYGAKSVDIPTGDAERFAILERRRRKSATNPQHQGVRLGATRSTTAHQR